jgi:hypothetical protein
MLSFNKHLKCMVGKSGYFFIFKFRYRSILGKLFKQRITLIHLGIYVPTISMCVVIPIIFRVRPNTTLRKESYFKYY